MAGVEATNHPRERALRPGVSVRQTGGCNQTDAGARTDAVWSSLLVRLQQQGWEVLEYLPELLTAPGQPPKLLATQAFDT
jgi:hypothetical protein